MSGRLLSGPLVSAVWCPPHRVRVLPRQPGGGVEFHVSAASRAAGQRLEEAWMQATLRRWSVGQ
jgi:hypothetical protein